MDNTHLNSMTLIPMFKSSILLIIFLLFTSTHTAQPNEKPNVVFILTDDLGYKDVGFNGCEDIATPNIDRIASNGVKFTNGYVSYPVCGPSRAGLITGRYQDRFGFSKNPLFAPKDPNMGLPLSEQTIPEYLDKSGYHSLAVGKWHFGAHPVFHPLNRGFDEFFGFLGGGHRYFPEEWTVKNIEEAKKETSEYRTRLLHNHTRVDETEYLTDALSRETVSFIDRNADRPFFIYLAYNAPHLPLQATEKYLKRYAHIKNRKRRIYAAMISAVDDGIGLVLNKLEEKGISENTIVIFMSDNGGPEHKNASENDPLKGGKGSLNEGGVRVPFAMQWPAKIKKGMVYTKPIISLDIFGSIVGNISPEISTQNPIDGVDLIPFLTGKKAGKPHAKLYWRKYIQEGKGMRSDNHKLVIKGSQNALYDLENDINETHNIKNKNPEKYNEMLTEWSKWQSQLKEPAFLGLMEKERYNKKHPDRFESDESENKKE
ncbi:sulfatase-like hydrolase/transferase [Christiangramia crocea]|uniref:Sulfatase-like hydrolase/transferase n=1 Tax=Christiangramia crocea TaxID=2904124 RepID=A0A9X1UYM7_9FLAO|nr:sulfatase-like hydrolase/transferase [Gramella crocea]MCG9972550.1 sulfatase-like hydrolase/transferase [Gramella crocea]